MAAPRALIPLGIAALAIAGCASPRPVGGDPSAPWTCARPPTPDAPTLFASDSGLRVAWAGVESIPPTPAVGAPTSEPPTVGLTDATERTKGTDPTFKLRGRIEADSVTVTQSPKDKALFGDFQDAVGFRRLRLGSEGTAGDMTRWVAEVDFAGGNVSIKDAFVAVHHLPFLQEVRVGHFAEPFSLEGQIRSVWFPFTERSPAFTFDPTRNWGVGVFSFTEDRRWVVQAGVFKSGTDNTGTDVGDGNDLAGTGRVVWVPWYEEADDSLRMLHIGGAASHRNTKDGMVSFNQGPQSSLLQSGSDNPRSPFVPAVSIPANQYQLYNFQSALVLGPLSLQAEWDGTRVEQLGGGPVVLSGWYVQASYFLTGEHRNYNRDVGTMWEPTVRRPFVCTDGTATARVRAPGRWRPGWRTWTSTARTCRAGRTGSRSAPARRRSPSGSTGT